MGNRIHPTKIFLTTFMKSISKSVVDGTCTQEVIACKTISKTLHLAKLMLYQLIFLSWPKAFLHQSLQRCCLTRVWNVVNILKLRKLYQFQNIFHIQSYSLDQGWPNCGWHAALRIFACDSLSFPKNCIGLFVSCFLFLLQNVEIL